MNKRWSRLRLADGKFPRYARGGVDDLCWELRGLWAICVGDEHNFFMGRKYENPC